MINKPGKNNKPLKNKIKTIISGGALLSALIIGDPSFAQSTQNNKNQVTTEINIQQENHGLKQMKKRLEKNADKEGIPGPEVFVNMLENYIKTKEDYEFIAMLMIINYIYEDKTITEEEKFTYAVFFAGSGEYGPRLKTKADRKKIVEYMGKEADFRSEILDTQIIQLKQQYENNKQQYENNKQQYENNKQQYENNLREYNLLKQLLGE